MSTWSGIDGANLNNNLIIAPNQTKLKGKVDKIDKVIEKPEPESLRQSDENLASSPKQVEKENSNLSIENNNSQVNNDTLKADEVIVEKLENKNEINIKICDNIEKYEDISKIDFNINEINLGFKEVELFCNKLYNDVYGKYQNFKPSLNDVIADVLAFIGGFAKLNDKVELYNNAFNIKLGSFADKYANYYSVPIIFQLSKWAKNNKNVDYSNDVLNGLIRCLLGFVNESQSDLVNKFLEKSYNFVNN